ncbi:hypothetical protein QMK61_00065 [Fulvimonas sp. R45]|uniref:hypothetical protein n=1 Tax=Fulvimonas sp. R45 TaxID=3045937 RepID=UPI00265F5A46|nr:hypothetical protein [Fulvimonas sp. R45]MDO1527214.1 hypothetical protein [Fulvimonas sp. R45]
MARHRRKWRRIAWAVFVVALVAILLLGAWRAVLYHRNGVHPSNGNVPPASSMASP